MKWKPEPKCRYRHPTVLWWCMAVFGGFGLGYFWPKSPIHDGGYPVYVKANDADDGLIAKLADCQQDWRDDQVTKKLLRMKLKDLKMQE